VPITFEITVLSAAIGTVSVMIALMFKFPHASHPLHDSNYMKSVSSDKFGISINAIDKIFDENKIKEFLRSLGGKNIETIYEENKREEIRMFDFRFIITIILVAVLTAGTTYFTLNKLLLMVPFKWMGEQDKVKAQTESTFFKDGFGMRPPVDGTVARGYLPYEYKGATDSIPKLISNPLPLSQFVIDKGKSRFDTYCSPCHGYFGQGDSRLHDQFPKPPPLHSDKVRNWPDANIYNVITNGQNNIMPSYEKQISRDDRWAIVHYIRVLQRAMNANDKDIDTTKMK
jgi:mono/diheme cytochrome c family protein